MIQWVLTIYPYSLLKGQVISGSCMQHFVAHHTNPVLDRINLHLFSHGLINSTGLVTPVKNGLKYYGADQIFLQLILHVIVDVYQTLLNIVLYKIVFRKLQLCYL